MYISIIIVMSQNHLCSYPSVSFFLSPSFFIPSMPLVMSSPSTSAIFMSLRRDPL